MMLMAVLQIRVFFCDGKTKNNFDCALRKRQNKISWKRTLTRPRRSREQMSEPGTCWVATAGAAAPSECSKHLPISGCNGDSRGAG